MLVQRQDAAHTHARTVADCALRGEISAFASLQLLVF